MAAGSMGRSEDAVPGPGLGAWQAGAQATAAITQETAASPRARPLPPLPIPSTGLNALLEPRTRRRESTPRAAA